MIILLETISEIAESESSALSAIEQFAAKRYGKMSSAQSLHL